MTEKKHITSIEKHFDLRMNGASQSPFFELAFFGYFFWQCKKVTAVCIRQILARSANNFATLI